MSKMSTIDLVIKETDTTNPMAVRRASIDVAIDFWGTPTSDQVSAVHRAMLVSIYGETSETVGQYNTVHAGKAWAVIGVTYEGAVFCADCVYDEPLAIWHPIFATDDVQTTCDQCLDAL